MKKKKELPTIQILSERTVPYVELEIKCDKKIQEELIEYGRKMILQDRDELLNYGFVRSLKEGIKYLENRREKK